MYSFELFTPEFCDLLLEEVENAQATAREHLERPNGMNRYGIVLNQLGLEPLITALQQEHLKPMQEALYPGPGTSPDDHHCFIVRYKAGEDVGLDMRQLQLKVLPTKALKHLAQPNPNLAHSKVLPIDSNVSSHHLTMAATSSQRQSHHHHRQQHRQHLTVTAIQQK